MRSTHTFAIDFIIRRCKENNAKAFIYARITVDAERKEISLKEQINAADWDSASETVNRRNIDARAINSLIGNTRVKIKNEYRNLQEGCGLITAETIKQAALGQHTSLKGHTLLELLEYYHKIWKPKLKHGGFKNIETTIRYVKQFLKNKYSAGDIFLPQINMEFATDFEHYIRTHPIKKSDPCLGNGLGKHIQRFKTILNWAVTIKWIKQNPIDKYSCPLKRNKRKKLSLTELFILEEKEFKGGILEYVKDLFIYSCYTGLAYVDVMALKEIDFEWDESGTAWCKIYRTKSDGFCPIPLLSTPAAILKKYKNHPALSNEKIFPPISNQHVNKSLQIIRETCEIETPITFHVARHTFAKTVALKNGVPMETVQIMMGHTEIKTTQIYAEVDEEKIIYDMRGAEEKINKRRETFFIANQGLNRNAQQFEA